MANATPQNPQQEYYYANPNATQNPVITVEDEGGYQAVGPTGAVEDHGPPPIEITGSGSAYPENSAEYNATAEEEPSSGYPAPLPGENHDGTDVNNAQQSEEPPAQEESIVPNVPESEVMADVSTKPEDDEAEEGAETTKEGSYQNSSYSSKYPSQGQTTTLSRSQSHRRHHQHGGQSYYDYYNSRNKLSANPCDPCNQQVYNSPCQIGVIPMRSAAFQAPRIPLPKLCQHLLPEGDDEQEDEDGVAFQFKPQTHCRTEVTFTIEPRPQPPWLTMLNCGFKPMVNCSAPPCYLSPNGNPGMDYMGGTQSVVNRAFGNEIQYCGMANFPTLQQIQCSFPGGKVIDTSKKQTKHAGSGSSSEESGSSSEGTGEEETDQEDGPHIHIHRYPHKPVGMPQTHYHRHPHQPQPVGMPQTQSPRRHPHQQQHLDHRRHNMQEQQNNAHKHQQAHRRGEQRVQNPVQEEQQLAPHKTHHRNAPKERPADEGKGHRRQPRVQSPEQEEPEEQEPEPRKTKHRKATKERPADEGKGHRRQPRVQSPEQEEQEEQEPEPRKSKNRKATKEPPADEGKGHRHRKKEARSKKRKGRGQSRKSVRAQSEAAVSVGKGLGAIGRKKSNAPSNSNSLSGDEGSEILSRSSDWHG